MSVLAMSKRFNQRPSSIIEVEDDYTAFCFDEACTFIMTQLENGKEIVREKHYSKLSDLYKDMGIK